MTRIRADNKDEVNSHICVHQRHPRFPSVLVATVGCARSSNNFLYFVSWFPFVLLTVCFFAGREEFAAPHRACLGGCHDWPLSGAQSEKSFAPPRQARRGRLSLLT